MRLFDPGFRKHKLRYIFQSFLAALSIFFVLVILEARENAAVIAALGASCFIVFTIPEAKISRPRFLLGGYVVGIAVGCLCHHLSVLPFMSTLPELRALSHELFGALSVGLAVFVMSVTDTEHPPAASLALGLVLNDFSHRTLLVVLAGIISLTLIRIGFKPFLKNLI